MDYFLQSNIVFWQQLKTHCRKTKKNSLIGFLYPGTDYSPQALKELSLFRKKHMI